MRTETAQFERETRREEGRHIKLVIFLQSRTFTLTPVKVAPYSFTMARALGTKAQVFCARSKENVSVFRYFIMSTRAQKAKLTVNFLAFPSVKFREPWQAGSKCFTLVGASFSRKSVRQVFL